MLAASSNGVDRSVDVGAASLAKHGSTFHLAHRLLGAKVGADVELLYGFCRFVDDIVDEQEAPRARQDLDRVRGDLDRGKSDDPEVMGFLRLTREHPIDPQVTSELMAGFEQDLLPGPYETTAELLRYCYRVAGTVGLLMCSLLDIESDEPLPFAVDLGLGMQLTNICRDVREDAERGRVYVPGDLTGGALEPAWVSGRDPGAERRARAGVEALLKVADRYYRSADAGMGFLPRRARFAVLVASRCYEAIGARVTRSAPNRIPGRVFVPGRAKLVYSLGAAGAWLRGPWGPPSGGGAVHRADLHAPLKGLPGVNLSWRA